MPAKRKYKLVFYFCFYEAFRNNITTILKIGTYETNALEVVLFYFKLHFVILDDVKNASWVHSFNKEK